MPKSDTWPGGVAMEPLSNMDSAGSCDSVISMNSGYSEDSMEYLSPEERACLMYLEETIEALEVQEDSGLSNDEQDLKLQAEQMGQMTGNDVSSLTSDESGRDKNSFLSHGVSTPPAQLAAEPAPAALSVTNENHILNKVSEPQSADERDLKPALTEGSGPAPDNKPKILASTLLSLGPVKSTETSEMDVGLIPPPSDFRDRPAFASQSQKLKVSSNKQGPTIDLEKLRERASIRSSTVSSSVTEEPQSKPPSSPSLTPPVVSPGPLLSPPPELPEPKSPPAVAPKPKRLPANIILKSHRTAAPDGHSGHSVPGGSDRLLLDPQRIRMEALRKLGLLKSDEAESVPLLSPKLSPKTRRSWAAPSPPISPAASHTPPPLTPSHSRFTSPPPASVTHHPASPAALVQSAPSVQPLEILPAPAAFSDSITPPPSDNELSAVRDVTEAAVTTPPLTPPALIKQLTPPKVKSFTLERSGLGLSSYMASQGFNEADQGAGGQTLGQLRNSRPRPASLGSGQEFSSAQGEDSPTGRAAGREPDSQRSAPAKNPFLQSGDSQKLPRSQGISVLICPRAENEEDRREALKKLGLLRD